MWSFIKQAYRDSARIAIALPLLFAVPVAFELIQHVAEYRAAMFGSVAAMEAAADDPARMTFGYLKVLTLILLLFWVSRWQVFRGQAGRPVLGDRQSALLYLGVVLFSLAIAIVQQFGGTWLAPLVPDQGALIAIGTAFFFASIALDTYLSGWKVGSALGNANLSIPASFRLMHGHFWWSFAFSFAMILPLLVVHYALNGLALGRPEPLLWTILVLDALLVGYFGLVLATTGFLIAGRAAEQKGVALAQAAQPA